MINFIAVNKNPCIYHGLQTGFNWWCHTIGESPHRARNVTRISISSLITVSYPRPFRSIICQEKTAGELRCPLLNPSVGGDKRSAYQWFLTNVEQFSEMYLTICFQPDWSLGVIKTLIRLWKILRRGIHPVIVQFSNYKLAKARKRKESNPHEKGRQTSKRRSIIMIEQCFLCEKGAD